MTYQSSPYLPWIFPDEAYHMNAKGTKPLRAAPIHNAYEPLPGGGSDAQRMFDSHDRAVVLERIRINKKKEQGMLGHLKTTVRSQRYERPMSRSAVPNGVFHDSPIEYTTSAGLRGGVITTKEGQEWLAKRLLQRREEYANLSSGNFSSGPPKRIDVTPYSEIDGLLQTIYTGFVSGSFSTSTSESLSRLLAAFIKVGASISPSQLTKYTQIVGKLIATTRPFVGTSVGERLGVTLSTREERLRSIDAINQTLKVIESVLREIARTINDTIPAREQAMSILGERLVQRQFENFKPGFIDAERQAGIEQAGEQVPTFGGPTQDIYPLPSGPKAATGEQRVEVPTFGPVGQGRRRKHYY